jgi:outer membrane lipoprotein-sorting protein
MFSAMFAVVMILLQEDSRKKPVPAVTSPRVEAILADWKKASAQARDIRFEYEQTTEDQAFDKRETTKGKVQLSRGNVCRIDLSDEKGNPTQIILQTDKALDWYCYDNRSVGHWPTDGARSEDMLTGVQRWVLLSAGSWARAFLGPAPGNIGSQFNVSLQKEDDYYLYLLLVPRTPEPTVFPFSIGAVNWVSIALEKKTFFVRQVVSEQGNGTKNTCLVKRVQVNVTPPITAELVSRDLPKGFRVETLTDESPQQKKP